ncbi:MAG: hypothetical protein NWE94_09090 [Candidatus Bathyarchaeota archaeon]|nr:hypothetical protein [Candidatus Bathyarchaeota archaeon]
MKLLISPADEKEALEAIAGGAEIIDVKNPKEGSLGASFPWVIRRIRELAPPSIEVSCAIGDAPNLPCAVSLAALGAATTGVDYIKIGLYGVRTKEEAIYLMRNVTKSVKNYNSSIKVVAAGYADAARVGSINPLLVPVIAHLSGADVAMIDTAVKDGENLFAYLTVNQLQGFVNAAHSHGLKAALAGSLRKEDLPTVYNIGADIAGMRSAACTDGDRINGRITREKVKELVDTLERIKKSRF